MTHTDGEYTARVNDMNVHIDIDIRLLALRRVCVCVPGIESFRHAGVTANQVLCTAYPKV